jgi:hypothetical protein
MNPDITATSPGIMSATLFCFGATLVI